MTNTAKRNLKKALGAGLLTGLVALIVAGCVDDARMASRNISKSSDNFEVVRKISFINGITDHSPLEIVGFCSIRADTRDRQLEVTCKDDGADEGYLKHYLGLSDNMSYVVEQLVASEVSIVRPRVTFKPLSIIADIDYRGGSLKQTPDEADPKAAAELERIRRERGEPR